MRKGEEQIFVDLLSHELYLRLFLSSETFNWWTYHVVLDNIRSFSLWYPSHYVYSSEHSVSGPDDSAGDTDVDQNLERAQVQDPTQHKVAEESLHTLASYDVGLETERAASLEQPPAENIHNSEQTVTPEEVPSAEVIPPEPKTDSIPGSPEPEPHPESQTYSERHSEGQDHDRAAQTPLTPSSASPASVTHDQPPPPAQDQASTDQAPPQALLPEWTESSGDVPAPQPTLETVPSPDPSVALSLDDIPDTPTSGSVGSMHTGAVWVASAGDEPPADSFVSAELCAELSDSQCGVKLATCANPPFGSPLPSEDADGVKSQWSEQQVREGDPQASLSPAELQEEHPALAEAELQGNATATLPPEAADAGVPRDTDPSVPSKGDIPTFDEWKKQVMEVEKEKSQSLHTSTNGSPHPVKKVQKNFKNNYASVECGAKILSANSEAKSTSAILMENMDLYMLNPCSNKIWFVIELCEPIQVKQLDIANFELFSSTPRDFLVSISDRYPTNKWVKLGTFHARDERTVQSFPLDEQLYAKYVKMFIKYIKVELLSHFGSEHFCPLSLIRVFGTSMVEEYEEIADSQYPSERLEYLEEDYDYPPGFQPSEDKAAKNLLGSATNAIMNMVNNIAANVLGGKPELADGTHSEDNETAEAANETEKSPEILLTATATPGDSATLETTAETGYTASQQDSNLPSELPTPTPSSPEPQEATQIVTLVEEEEEQEEEAKQSTVTLMEKEEGEDDEEEHEERRRREGEKEKMKREERRRWRESQMYCPLSSSSFSFSLSCIASLPELLRGLCSARLARGRQHSFRRGQLNAQRAREEADAQRAREEADAQRAREEAHSPVATHAPPALLTPVAAASPSPTSVQETLPLTQSVVPEPDPSSQTGDQGTPPAEAHTHSSAHTDTHTHTHPGAHTPVPSHAPEPRIVLEPSRTATIPPHSFSHVSLSQPTPTQEEGSGDEAALDSAPLPTLHRVSVMETQAANSASFTPAPSLTLQPLRLRDGRATTRLRRAPRRGPAHAIPPPTELPPPALHTDTHADPARPGPDGGELPPKPVLQASHHTLGEQADTPASQAGELQRVEESVEELLLSTNGNIQRSATEYYAELQGVGDYVAGGANGNGAMLNGATVHGSSQKESVFMRLNNRIKALEMNMSLSSRYLEELSQRYRKQMEEMQRAFNKTIVKLQNTSRMAEEQDQKQTDSIQVLQSQLENVTKLMLNLTATVSQLQREVSDRQCYLVVSLVLCLSLGLLLCLQCCRSSPHHHTTHINPPALPKSNHYPSPKRCFSSYDDMSLMRRVTCPLVRSKSFQLSSTDGPDDLYIVEPLRFSPEKKKKRCKTKPSEKVEALNAPCPPSSDPLANGGPNPPPSSSSPLLLLRRPPPRPPHPSPQHAGVTSSSVEEVTSSSSSSLSFGPPPPPAETGSCSSSTHSEESYASRLSPPSPSFSSSSPGLCMGRALPFPPQPHQLPASKPRQEKRSVKRRKSRQAELQFPSVPEGGAGSLPSSLQQLIKGNKDISVGTIGVTAVTGHV
ncbi:SUN domain-containing ossification factor [Merluccius polli]|uniref:SUN domain-containing ossification factor n=1 Tax=Merluccius polli TaxID=89951 RepID=A0AA47P1W3_MERPO|nr:SUN domain-containing ossification factor [Merluccius polli]